MRKVKFMGCAVSTVMGSDDAASCLGINSMDLYSKVKLRETKVKVNGGRHGSLGLHNVKPMNSGSAKSRPSAGMKSGMIGKRECNIMTINSDGELATKHSNSQGHKRVWLVAFKERKIDIPNIDREGNRRGVFSETGRSPEEETAIEVLGSFKATRSETTMGSEFKVGDLVWGKIENHPWWPGYIYDEALAKSSVMRRKTEGFLLVTFFGDDTYSWTHPKNLLPYERHFLLLSKQPKSEGYKKAVEDSINEVHKREEFAFSCQCRKPSNGNEEGDAYTVGQVKRFRREFKPVEIVSFLHKLALGPMDLIRDGHSERNVARVLGYRKAVFAGDSSPYKEAHASPDGWSDGDSIDCKEALPQGVVRPNISIKAEVPSSKTKTKGSSNGHSRPNITRGKIKRAKVDEVIDGPKLSKTDCREASGDHVYKNRSEGHQRNQVAFVDKKTLVSKPSNPTSRIMPVEKAERENVRDPPKSRNKERAFVEGAEATTKDKNALICKPSKPLSRILPVGKSVGPPNIRIEFEEKELASSKDEEADLGEPGEVLVIKFPPQALIPSTSELKAKFARFGRLDTSAMYSSWKSSKCHVSFKKASDADSARDRLLRRGDMYNNRKVTCYLESVGPTPSPKSHGSPNSLEKASTKLPHQWFSKSGEENEGGKKSTLLLSEVKGQEGQTEKYQQTIPPVLPLTGPIFPEASSQQALSPVTTNKKHLDSSQTTLTTTNSQTTLTTAATSSIDISAPMLKLLKEIDIYFEELKSKQNHWHFGDYKKA